MKNIRVFLAIMDTRRFIRDNASSSDDELIEKCIANTNVQVYYDELELIIEGLTAGPSELCKLSGLTSMEELAELLQTSRQNLINWHREKPAMFDAMLAGAAMLKNPRSFVGLCKTL